MELSTSTNKRARAESKVEGATEQSTKKPKVEGSSKNSAEVEQKEASQQTLEDKRPSLEDLLDLTAISDHAQLTERFDQVARALLYDYYMVVNQPGKSTKLEIMEMEFYVQKEGFHEDPFTHGSEEQKIAGRWYVTRPLILFSMF